jgi:hypothetical protein
MSLIKIPTPSYRFVPYRTGGPSYYRKEPICSDECDVPNTQEVFKSVECCETITPTRQANTVLSPTYYTSNAQYLKARCRTYDQRAFHFEQSGGTLLANCSQSCPSGCRTVSYKPNNAPFSTQGAVSSSNRIMRLKYDAITGGASGNCPDCRIYHGDATMNTYFKDTTCQVKYVWKNGKKIACR